jgi:uncharacterized protein YjbI with pentapeptide repeats
MAARVVNSANDLLRFYEAGERNFQGAVLEGANLEGAILAGVSLRQATLSHANLIGADLRDTNLQEASVDHARLTRANLDGAHIHDIVLEHAILTKTTLIGAVATDANCNRADFSGANLGGARLDGVNFTDAKLANANLCLAKLGGANLSRADMTEAQLVQATLDDAVLDGAILERANLEHAYLVRTSMQDVRADGIRLGDTHLVDLSLAALCRADVRHVQPSHVDFRAIMRSLGAPRLKDFLRSIDMPDVFVEYMVDCARSLGSGHVFSLLQSTFISYGGPDEAFARKLNDALKRSGVTTFFFKDDALPGEQLHGVMRRGVNEHDRVILICSKDSLLRPGVLFELKETLAREARDGGNEYLLPVRLDDYVFGGWNPPDPTIARTVRDRVIADFRNHDDIVFNAALSKLVAALKKKPANPIVHE